MDMENVSKLDFTGLFDIEPEVEERKPLYDDEYMKDNMRYCKNCHEPREIYLMSGYMPQTCRCQQEEKKRKELESIEDKKRERIKENKKSSNMKGKEDITFGSMVENADNREAIKQAKDYVMRFNKGEHPQNLIILGSVGTGKTTVAYAIGNNLLARGHSVFFANVYEIVNQRMGEEYRGMNYWFDDLCYDSKLLIIDDIGAERNTSFAKERLVSLVDYRVSKGKATLYTTDLTEKQLYEGTNIDEQRLYDRMLQNSEIITMNGASFRRKK